MSNENLTQDEILKRRAELLNFYSEQIPFLKEQAEYERLIAEIAIHRTDKLRATMEYVNLSEMLKEKPEQDTQDTKE